MIVPARPATGVLDVGNAALDQLVILIPKRQLPEAFTAFLSGVQQRLDKALVVAEDGRGLVSQGNDAGSGQGCQVDNQLWLVTFRISQGVGEDQAAFGIGVEDFDRSGRRGWSICRRADRLFLTACSRPQG